MRATLLCRLCLIDYMLYTLHALYVTCARAPGVTCAERYLDPGARMLHCMSVTSSHFTISNSNHYCLARRARSIDIDNHY